VSSGSDVSVLLIIGHWTVCRKIGNINCIFRVTESSNW